MEDLVIDAALLSNAAGGGVEGATPTGLAVVLMSVYEHGLSTKTLVLILDSTDGKVT